MSTVPTTALHPGQVNKLAAARTRWPGWRCPPGEPAPHAWIAGFRVHTMKNVAAVITRRPASSLSAVAWNHLLAEVPPRGSSPGHRQGFRQEEGFRGR